jgi:hypothetical protein
MARMLRTIGAPMKPSVTLDEIDDQRGRGWPDFHPEDYCHRCGGRNIPSWFVDSDRFNAAFGSSSEHPYQGIVCPGCFVEAHEQATGLRTTWRLVIDQPFRPIDGDDGGGLLTGGIV